MSNMFNKFTLFVFFTLVIETLANEALAQEAKEKETKGLTYAMISAVGESFSIVRQKQQVGSHLEPYRRTVIEMPDNALNYAVLRGLDRALAEAEPTSQRIFITLKTPDLAKINPQDREQAILQQLKLSIADLSQRAEWDRIILVTPRYHYGELNRLGTKLHGLGIYIQPLYSGSMTVEGEETDFDAQFGDQAVTPDGKAINAKRYIAPYFYTSLWVLDAKTLAPLSQEIRYDTRKIFDPDSTAIDVAKSLPPEVLARQFQNFIERASANAVYAWKKGVVIIRPVEEKK